MTASPGWMRDLHHWRRWLCGWLLLIVAVVVASLAPADGLRAPLFEGADKVGHFLAYAALSGYAVMLFARMRAQALAAIALVILGIAMEVVQGQMTQTRQASSADALANTFGVLAGLLLAGTPVAYTLSRVEARLAPRR